MDFLGNGQVTVQRTQPGGTTNLQNGPRDSRRYSVLTVRRRDICPTKTAGLNCEIYHSGRVNGITVNIVLDTGVARTLVQEDLVPPEVICEREVTITCAHGDTITYPVAHINISVGSLPDVVKAAVSKNLPAAVLLGWDVSELKTLLKHVQQAQPQKVLTLTTRAQTREQE